MAGAIAIIVAVGWVGPGIRVPIGEIWLCVPVSIERRSVIGFGVAIAVRVVCVVVRLGIAVSPVSVRAVRRAPLIDHVSLRLIDHRAATMPSPLRECGRRRQRQHDQSKHHPALQNQDVLVVHKFPLKKIGL